MNTRQPASGLSSRTRRRAALIAALALPISLMTAPAIAQGPTPSPATPQTVPSTPTSVALTQAKKDNKRVEIEALRSETGTYFANPDGKTLQAELSSTPIRVKKDGAWQPIDTRLIEKDGVLQPKASLGDLTLSAGGGTNAVTYTDDKGKASLAAPATLPKPVVKDNTATYPDAYGPGADLVVTVTPSGFRNDVVIRQRPAKELKLRVPMRLPKGLKLGKGADKTPGVLDAKGKEVTDLSSATILDAAAMSSPDQGLVGKASTAVDGDSLVLTAPSDFLADPAVTYPVTVTAASEDWVGTGIAGDTHVSNVRPSGRDNATLQWLLAGRSHSGTQTHRSYIRFNIHGTPLEGGTVENGDLRLHNYNSHTCDDEASAGIVAHRITTPWTVDTITWDNQPSVTISGQVGNRAAYSSQIPCPEGEGELYYSIEQMVQAWMNGEPDEGVRLISPTETVAQNWRYYRSDEYGGYDTYPFTPRGPVLIIKYTPAPTETEAVYYSYEGPELTEPPTYEQAVAMRAQTHPDGPDPSPVTYEQLQTLAETRSSVPTYVKADDLPDDNPQPDPDTTAPRVGITTPPANATDVPTNVQIAAYFSETVSDAAIVVKDAQGAKVAGNASIDTENVILTFAPSAPLATGSVYTAEVSGAKDGAGNVMTPYSWSFTTGGGTDTNPPAVTGIVPAQDAADVPADTTVKVTFSEAVTGVQVTVKDPANAPMQGTLDPLGGYAEWVFTPSKLTAQTTYQVEVANAKDATGNVMAPFTWSFTTGAGAPPPTPGLVAAYGMNEGSGTSVADSSGQNNAGTGSSTTWANGKYGKALSFNGSSSWITVQDAASLRLTTGMTLSAWVNPATVANWSSVVAKELSAGGVSYTMYAANGSSAPSGWVQTDPASHSTVTGISPLPVNTWSHLALTYDSAALRLFVNGQQIAQTALSGNLYNDGSPLRIGGNKIWGEYFSGLIDEVRVYNRAQTTDQIQADMNTPVGSTTPGPDPTPTPTPTPTPDPTPNPVPGLVAAYGMEEGTGTTVGDSSGQNNTGAATDTSWTTGKHGKALSFNGSSSWVSVPHAPSLRLTNAVTLSAWVQPTARGWSTVLMKDYSEGGSYGLYASKGTDTPAGWFQTADYEDGGAEGPSPLPLDQWSHLAVTYDGSLTRLYVNGIQVAQESVSGELVDDGGALRIGGNTAWGEFFSGLIDEVRIYNRVQTATEIQTDMNTPVGAAASGAAAPRLQKSSALEIQKLAVNDSHTVDGATVTSTLTPRLTTWLSAGRDGEAKVEMEIARKPTKSVKTDKATTDKRLIWSSQATAKPGDSQVTLQVPKGKLRNGETVRWRARVMAGSINGTWSTWHNLALSESPQEQATRGADASAATTEPPEFTVDHLTAEECESDRLPDGRYVWKDVALTFTWCYTHWYGVTFYAKVWDPTASKYVKSPVGWTQFRGSTVINTRIGRKNNDEAWDDPNRKSRDIDVWMKINRMRTVGNTQNATIRTYVKLAGSPSSSQCQPMSTAERQSSLPGWESDKYAHFIIQSNKGSIGPNYLGTCTISPFIEVASPLGDEDFDQFNDPMQIACDTEQANFNYVGGCVFQKASRILQYETTSVAHGAVARHIKDAYYNPAAPGTAPAISNKVVPGNFTAPRDSGQGQPLHRTTDAALRADTTTQIQKGCNTLTFYVAHECDEYPFNSTWEGGGRKWKTRQPLSDNYSVRYVFHSANESAGTSLNWFYWRYRIMDGSPFWVMITTNNNPVDK
ncbi:LamG-like jellyroll fold domain-containing protein [Nonomuraea sp. NPDC049400]|uniref:LamG-like jellyroll fold domain-containing protein n=1 Tax=Nonomuraea sp. NPDC049400 TaxID=3364352 RepID=UPI003794A5BC